MRFVLFESCFGDERSGACCDDVVSLDDVEIFGFVGGTIVGSGATG